jgi:hypothetical protein
MFVSEILMAARFVLVMVNELRSWMESGFQRDDVFSEFHKNWPYVSKFITDKDPITYKEL